MKKVLLALSVLAMSVSMVQAKERTKDRFLGKQDASQVESEASPDIKKAPLLGADFVDSHPELSNARYWGDAERSTVYQHEQLSFDYSSAEEGSDGSVDISGFKDMSYAVVKPHNEEERKSTITPPVRAVLGVGHHSGYDKFEALKRREQNINFLPVLSDDRGYLIRSDIYWKELNGVNVMEKQFLSNPEAVVSYTKHFNELVLSIARESFHEALRYDLSMVDVDVLNPDASEFKKKEFPFVVREICLTDKLSGNKVFASAKLDTKDGMVMNLSVFEGIQECGGS